MTKAQLTQEKRSLTKEIKSLETYVRDADEQLANQHPQPNGAIYLHGEIIAFKRRLGGSPMKTPVLTRAIKELQDLKTSRANLDNQ